MSTIAERVAAGAAYLDEHDPQWWRPDVERAINLDALCLDHVDLCILGQRCPVDLYFDSAEWMGRYDAFAAKLSGIVVFDRSDLEGWAVALGFQAEPVEGEEETADYAYLAREWKRVITERRSAATQAAIAAIGSRCTSCSQKRVNCRCPS